jgi:transposase, IS30 family
MEDENIVPRRTRRPKLNESERVMIEYLWNVEQLSQSEIGKRLNHSQSVIARELKPDNTLDHSHFSRAELLRLPIHVRIKYSATRGQYNSVKNGFRFGQGSKLTPELKQQIEYWINDEKWTPEQVAADIEDVDISASIIRQWARRKEIDIKISHYKATSKAERERNKSLREKEIELSRLRSQLRDTGELARHSIYDRPETVNKRKQFGHWEVDLVLPAKGNEKTILDPSAILTIVKRKTRFFASK